jgi:hypothetical protein
MIPNIPHYTLPRTRKSYNPYIIYTAPFLTHYKETCTE